MIDERILPPGRFIPPDDQLLEQAIEAFRDSWNAESPERAHIRDNNWRYGALLSAIHADPDIEARLIAHFRQITKP